MDYRARDTTQSDFWAHYGALCQKANEVSRVMAESNVNASNSISLASASMAQCCCNFEETRMRIEEQTVEHYVSGFNSPFVTRQSVVQFINNDLEKRVNDLMLQNMQAYAYSAYGSGEANSKLQKTMREELSQCKTHGEMLQVVREHRCAIDLTKPEKKYTVYDLYDLVFPDDPIKEHFDAIRKEIEEKYKPQEEIAEKLEAPEVRRTHPEPIHTVTYDEDMMTVIQAAVFWIGAIVFVVILILT